MTRLCFLFIPSHRGNPKGVDTLLTDALTIGAQMDKKAIDTDVIMAAENKRQLG